MRGCLFRLLVIVAMAVAVAWILTPMAADALIEGALTATGFQGSGTTVDATADPPPLLLTGHADRVRIRSSNVRLHELQAASLDLQLSDVDLFARSFSSVAGTLSGVRIVPQSGPSVDAASATIQGPATAARVALLLDRAEVEALVSSGIAAAVGPVPAAIALAPPDRVTFNLEGRSAAGQLAVQGGALVLRPVGVGLSSIVLLQPPASTSWRVGSVTVTSAGLEVRLVVDLQGLIG